MSSKKDDRSARELINHIRANIGLNYTEIAAELQRDRRMVNKIMRGETSGEVYRAALLELATKGQVTNRPPRRRDAAGKIVPVRSGGKGTPTVRPEETAGTYVPQPKRGRFAKQTTYLREGGRRYNIEFPKTEGTKGREAGMQEVLAKARQIKSQDTRWGTRRVKFQVTYANGRVIELGSKAGYRASDFLSGAKAIAGGAVGWLDFELGNRRAVPGTSTTLPLPDAPITGVTMTVYAAGRDPEPDFG